MTPNPALIGAIRQSAARYGADPVALLATAIQESGGRYNAVGDQGTSFGPFQYHQGGALGTHTRGWAMSNAEVADEAQRFAHYGVHGGVGAAAVQRPLDPQAYAQGVQRNLALARQLLGSSPPTPSLPIPTTTSTAPANPGGGAVSGVDPRSAFVQQQANTIASLAHIPQTTLPQVQIPVQAEDIHVPLRQPVATPPQAGPIGRRVISLARQYLGTPYRWGGTTPQTGFDCSGFAQYLYRKVGVNLPRTTFQQVNAGHPVDMQRLAPGDLVFFNTEGANTHEGIYIGGGRFIHAPHTGDVVRISSLSNPYYQQHFSTARRIT